MKNYKKLLALFLVIALFTAFIPVLLAQEVQKININKASADELAQLEGIGQKYAERIVEFRTNNGPFKSIEDILNVPGIGPKTYEANKDRITIE
ncbi:MAG TPA: helix-hairpin-helix domain-containing protein [Desulfatiglandales bacterium]|nr:helix-hairpin-helix domain-containing protein [Desulfatiglandales bacterium]